MSEIAIAQPTNNAVGSPVQPEETEAQRNEKIRILLSSFVDGHYQPDLGVAFHKEPKGKISIPEGMTLTKAADQIVEAARASRETQVYTRKFNYRPYDGAAALVRVLEKHFGTTGRGKPIQTFFGPILPRQIEVEVGWNATKGRADTIQVPWGHLEFVPLEGTLMMDSTYDEELGQLFQLSVECPKMYGAAVHGFFFLLEEELKHHSIYKGKAIRGTEQPRFIPLETDPSIVYNQSVYDALETSVWGVIRETALMRRLRVKTDPKVLLHGPYGTGKSETGRLTAKIAVENGWTFIQFNSGKASVGDLEKALQNARLLAPAVVFVEDVDIYASTMDEAGQTRMLEMFDGISSKGHEVMVLMTSNHPAHFQKGMLRAGRIDRMVEIGALDREATERLIRAVNAGQLGEVDFDVVWEALEGYEPAFVRATFDDARQAAAIRHATKLRESGTYTEEAATKFVLETEDFVTASTLKRPQWEAHRDAEDRQPPMTIDKQIASVIGKALTEGVVLSNPNIGVIDVEAADPHEATA